MNIPKCEMCKVPVSKEEAEESQHKFGKVLCDYCQMK